MWRPQRSLSDAAAAGVRAAPALEGGSRACTAHVWPGPRREKKGRPLRADRPGLDPQ